MEHFNLENPFQDELSETISSLFQAESDHMPSENYFRTSKSEDFDVSFRQNAVSLVHKLSCGFDPFVAYLAVNYLDRFVSTQGVPFHRFKICPISMLQQGKPWILKLLSISCLSLAAKMKKLIFSFSDFLIEEGFVFDGETIRRMELLVLGTLKWRMRSITPFSFVSFFLSLFKLKDPPLKDSLKSRAAEIIFKSQNEMRLSEYKPSVIAASALLSASHELFPLQFPCFRKAISSCEYVNKEKLFDCYDQMQEVVMDGYDSSFEMHHSSDTPVNVLDHNYSSSESEKNSVSRSEPEQKRRKMSGSRDKKTFQLSQFQHCSS